MTPELKTKWVEALRSGKYHQGAGKLRGHDFEQETFCCLGVLCEIAEIPRFEDGYNVEGQKETISLGAAGLVKIGLGTKQQHILVDMNDGIDGGTQPSFPQHSFSQIADYIEANL